MHTDLLIIFAAQAVFVSMSTVRWILLVRGRRWLAASISLFEMSLQVLALSLVVTQIRENPLNVVAYASGHAAGSLIGSKVEETLAIGYHVFQIITRPATGLADRLRALGFGVTSWGAEGREGGREVLMVVARRRFAHDLYAVLDQVDPHAFVVRLEPQAFRGGYLLRFIRR